MEAGAPEALRFSFTLAGVGLTVTRQMRAAMAQGFDKPTGDEVMDAWFSRALRREAGERFQDARSMREARSRALPHRPTGRGPDDTSTRRPAPA